MPVFWRESGGGRGRKGRGGNQVCVASVACSDVTHTYAHTAMVFLSVDGILLELALCVLCCVLCFEVEVTM